MASQNPITTAANGVDSNIGPAVSELIDRVMGSDSVGRMREKAKEAKTSLTEAGATAVETAKARPVVSILSLIGGLALIGLLAHPTSRKAAIDGGRTLMKGLGQKMPTT
jgi:hypothetical protein